MTDRADATGLKTQRGDPAVGVLIARHRSQVIRLAAKSSSAASGVASRADSTMVPECRSKPTS